MVGRPSVNKNKREVYMVAEGYHKTDSCYYKTPDGGYHKLPPDSYHKMSEICYNKLPDGSFKRLVDIKNANNSGSIHGSDGSTNNTGQSKMRNQMIRFLKRSKSHTPATAKDSYTNYRKDMQRTKEKERRQNDGGKKSILKNQNTQSNQKKEKQILHRIPIFLFLFLFHIKQHQTTITAIIIPTQIQIVLVIIIVIGIR